MRRAGQFAAGAALSAAAAAALVAGCGQKGPLYLPDKHAAAVTQPAPAATPPPDAAQPAGTAAPKPRDEDQDSPPPK
jgi:predicted small lipoprotein YifL